MKYKTNHIVIAVLVVLAVAGGAFYGGMQYEKKIIGSLKGQNRGENFQGRTGGGQRQGGGPERIGGVQGVGGDFIGGTVISKDDKSITVKTRDGGTKIVYFSDSTTVRKSVDGSVSDLANDQEVMVNGKNNPDGSLAAQNIQIRPGQAK